MAVLIQQERFGPARVRLKPLLDRDPNDMQAVFLFGLTYHKEQKYGLARGYFERARAIDASYAPTHYFRGWAMYYLGELGESRASFDTFLTLQPEHADAVFALGLIDMDEGDLESAERRFFQSIELARGEVRGQDVRQMSKGHARLGELYEQEDRLQEAKDQLIRATALFPDHYEAYYKLARVLTRLGETDAARQAQRQFFESKERVRPGSTGGAATQPEVHPVPMTPANKP